MVDNKIVDSDAFLEVDGPIRKAFELIVKVWDKKDRTSAESLKVAFNSIEGHLRKAEVFFFFFFFYFFFFFFNFFFFFFLSFAFPFLSLPFKLSLTFSSFPSPQQQTLTNILLPHLQAKSIARVKNIFSYVGSARFLQSIMLDDELEDEVHELVKAIEYYTQFHHYKEDKKK